MSAAPASRYNRELLITFAIWLVFGCYSAWSARPLLAERIFPDPDDAMRLMQVRDWIAGQSWFDVTQYRLNAPAGGPMHWSRIVDVPIAAVILIARPMLGQFGAETAALIAIPLLTLGITMLLVHRVASQLVQGPAVMLSVLATPLSLGAMKQMKIMRIDHHGWQIVLALVAMLAMLDRRPVRSGIMAGMAMAFWLNISIEGLPFAAAVGAWLGYEWLHDAAAGERLKSYLGALTLGSVGLFAATHLPSVWFAQPHDALNDGHFAALGAAWLCCLVVVRKNVASRWTRGGLLAVAGLVALAAMFTVDRHALQGPFSSLDPLVRAFWYKGIDEGLPVWELSADRAATALAQPIVGLLGAIVAISRSRGDERHQWVVFTWLYGAISLSALFVVREATTASVLSLPATAYLCALALRRARGLSMMPVRVVGTTGALLLMTPAYAAPALLTPADLRISNAMQSSDTCVRRSELEKLAALPMSTLATPLDITPAILASTQHRAIAAGYHRNISGIHDVILLFAGPADRAPEILSRRRVNYVVFCPRTVESLAWAHRAPNGLSALLNANAAPDWLDPVDLRLHGLRVWRVRAAAGSAPRA